MLIVDSMAKYRCDPGVINMKKYDCILWVLTACVLELPTSTASNAVNKISSNNDDNEREEDDNITVIKLSVLLTSLKLYQVIQIVTIESDEKSGGNA